MVSIVLVSREYLHSMNCRHLLPLYVVSSTISSCEFLLYPMALMMSGVQCFGLLWFGNRVLGIMVGCFVVALLF